MLKLTNELGAVRCGRAEHCVRQGVQRLTGGPKWIPCRADVETQQTGRLGRNCLNGKLSYMK